jgi:hypothetical protein
MQPIQTKIFFIAQRQVNCVIGMLIVLKCCIIASRRLELPHNG